MKNLIIPLLLIGILTGCAPSGSTNETSLDKTYTISQLSYKVSSAWEYERIEGANYFYLPDGSVLSVSNLSLGSFSIEDAKMRDNLFLAFMNFTDSASNVNLISDNFDSENNINTSTFTAEYEKGIQYVNYYAAVGDKYLYRIVLTGDTNSQDKLDKLFHEVISSVSLEKGTQIPVGIGLSKYEIIKMLDERLKEHDYPTFSNASKTISTLKMEVIGDVTYEVYTLANGLSFGFYSDIKTDELLQFVYAVDRNRLPASAYGGSAFISASLPFLLERDTYEDLEKRLEMTSDKKYIDAKDAGTERQYYYFKEDNLSGLYVYPVGEEILVRAAETTPSPSAETPATLSPSDSSEAQSSAPAQQQTQPTSQPIQNTSSQLTPRMSSDTPQPSKSESDLELQPETPSPEPVPKDNPTFKGGILLGGEVEFNESIMFNGMLSGISSPQDLYITCHYPNGTTGNTTIENVRNGDYVYYYFKTEDGGLGSGTLTVELVSTGEVLAKYKFTVIESEL